MIDPDAQRAYDAAADLHRTVEVTLVAVLPVGVTDGEAADLALVVGRMGVQPGPAKNPVQPVGAVLRHQLRATTAEDIMAIVGGDAHAAARAARRHRPVAPPMPGDGGL